MTPICKGRRNQNHSRYWRLATSSQQKQNRKIQSNNRSRLKGAYYHACRPGMKWRSQIKVGGCLKFLGYYETAREAHEAYKRAAFVEFGEFASYDLRSHDDEAEDGTAAVIDGPMAAA